MSSREPDSGSGNVSWEAREVVREVDHKPHLLLRITVVGATLKHRALVPVMQILEGEKVVAQAWFTEIGDDNLSLKGYFTTDAPEGRVEFGYPDQALGRAPERVTGEAIERLDRDLLAKKVVVIAQKELEAKRDTT